MSCRRQLNARRSDSIGRSASQRPERIAMLLDSKIDMMIDLHQNKTENQVILTTTGSNAKSSQYIAFFQLRKIAVALEMSAN